MAWHGKAVRVAALAALLAACSSEPDSSTKADVRESGNTADPGAAQLDTLGAFPSLAVEAEGLRLVQPDSGVSRSLPFGTERSAVMTALLFLDSPEESGALEECGAGPLDYVSWPGLTLHFQGGKLAGWTAREGRSIATVAGIGPGSSRAELVRAYRASIFESSLGTEFDAGGVFGLLDGPGDQARVTHLWAGANCIMR